MCLPIGISCALDFHAGGWGGEKERKSLCESLNRAPIGFNAGVGVGMMRGHHKEALCALLPLQGVPMLLTFPGGPMCFIDIPRGPYFGNE